MKAEILLVGTELLLGDIVDTNGKFLARQLAQLGIHVYYQTVVGDNPGRLEEAVRRALGRSELVLAAGGLGPTDDDITREVFSRVLELPLEPHQPTRQRLEAFFAGRSRPMTPNNLRQALVPQGATVLTNDWGTAPGLWIPAPLGQAVLLPGPPRELEPMFCARVRPRLEKMCPSVLESRTLRLYGVGESQAAYDLQDLMAGADPSLAPYAKDGEMILRLTASGQTVAHARQRLAPLEDAVRERLGQYVYAVGEDKSLEQALVERFASRGLTVAAAESLTGGLISQRITSVPGASAVTQCSVCSYSNEVKHRLLGVDQQLLDTHGAVSEPVALAMAQGVRRLADSHVGISATGYAGPTGDPVGLVYVAAVYGDRQLVRRLDTHRNAGERAYIRTLAANAALALALQITDCFSDTSCKSARDMVQ